MDDLTSFERADVDFEDRYDFRNSGPFARGGQAEIFQVYDRYLRREVALKRLSVSGTQGAVARARFFAEAQITAQLQHPGFLPILDSGLDPFGRPFYTTYLLPGRTFQDVIATVHASAGDGTDRVAFRRAVEVFERVTVIVAYAHSREVFHRDLKPNNILLGHFDEVYVIDMGAAFVAWAERQYDAASLSSPVGKAIRTDRDSATQEDRLDTKDSGRPWHPLYSPPEMVRGDLLADPRTTDIYALGVMLYELISGRRPYENPDRSFPEHEELIRRIQQGPPVPLREVAGRVSRDLVAIATKAMHYEPGRRYGSVDELAGDLRAYLETRVVRARQSGMLAQGCKWVQRHALGVAAWVMMIAVLALAGGIARNLKLKSDAASTLNHLREAQLAARSGEWLDALRHLESAEQAGYADGVDLGLQRYAAYIALSKPFEAAKVLSQLESLPGLGERGGAVKLRRAEFELFSPDTAAEGVGHVRQALEMPLDRADRLFAQGLIASTTPEALEFFHQALEVDPYHHGAHRQSLGLEFILARNERLASHIATLRVLYPADPSPIFLEASRFALDGKTAEAEAAAARLRTKNSPEAWVHFTGGLRMIGEVAQSFELGAYVMGAPTHGVSTNPLVREAMGIFLPQPGLSKAGADSERPPIRLPQLPCIKAGLEKGIKALMTAFMSGSEGGDSTMKAVDEALAIHPEGLIAFAAASLRDAKRPADPLQLLAFHRTQERLLESAARLPSVLTPLPVIARLLELVHLRDTLRLSAGEGTEERQRGHSLLEWFVMSPHPSGSANRKLYEFAFEFGEYDLARIFLERWERAGEPAPDVVCARIELEMATESYPRALAEISELLQVSPGDTWALEMKARTEKALRRALEPTGALDR